MVPTCLKNVAGKVVFMPSTGAGAATATTTTTAAAGVA
jgi:hypothetical protein